MWRIVAHCTRAPNTAVLVESSKYAALPCCFECLVRKREQEHCQWIAEKCHAKIRMQGMRQVLSMMADTLLEGVGIRSCHMLREDT